MESIIHVEDLSIAYNEKPVLWDADVDIAENSKTAIVGPNGAGKSTLIKGILNLVKPITGEVQIMGKPYDKVYKEIAYIPQKESVNWLFPTSVFDVVLMGRYGRLGWLKRPGRHDREIARDAVDRMGLSEFSHRQISELSGGQKQRVFLARAIAEDAKIYFIEATVREFGKAGAAETTTQSASGTTAEATTESTTEPATESTTGSSEGGSSQPSAATDVDEPSDSGRFIFFAADVRPNDNGYQKDANFEISQGDPTVGDSIYTQDNFGNLQYQGEITAVTNDRYEFDRPDPNDYRPDRPEKFNGDLRDSIADGSMHHTLLNVNGRIYVSGKYMDGLESKTFTPLSGLSGVSVFAADGYLGIFVASGRAYYGKNNQIVEVPMGEFDGASGVSRVAAGSGRVYFILDSSNKVFAFGEGASLYCGNAAGDYRQPADIPGGALDIEAGGNAVMAIGLSNNLYVWGRGEAVRELIGVSSANLPTLVGEVSNVCGVSTDGESAIISTNDGKVYLYGKIARDYFGSSKKELAIPAATVILRHGSAMILRHDGVVVQFGSNAFGQLGIGTNTAVDGGNYPDGVSPNFAKRKVWSIGAGMNTSFYICEAEDTGEVMIMACGENEFGQLGIDIQLYAPGTRSIKILTPIYIRHFN